MLALALLVVNDVTASPPPRALTLPRKPYARDLLYFHHGLLAFVSNHTDTFFDILDTEGARYSRKNLAVAFACEIFFLVGEYHSNIRNSGVFFNVMADLSA